jgi:ribosomal protein S27E
MALRDRILNRASPETAAAMEAESRTSMVRCRKCGNERSIWDMGGLRYKARGRPRRLIRCTNCRRLRWAEVYRRAGSRATGPTTKPSSGRA